MKPLASPAPLAARLAANPPGIHAGRWIAGGLAVLFGLATLVEGGHVLFGCPAARAEAGHVVPFVLWFNFTAGFVYIAAGLGAVRGRAWALWLARALAVTTLAVFAALGVHILSGGAYEPRTPVAMTIRSGFWLAQAFALSRWLKGDVGA